MSAFLIEVDPHSPKPPFTCKNVYVVKGLAELPHESAEGERLIICLSGRATVRLETRTFDLDTPSQGLLVPSGSEVKSVGGQGNIAAIVFSSV